VLSTIAAEFIVPRLRSRAGKRSSSDSGRRGPRLAVDDAFESEEEYEAFLADPYASRRAGLR
jgi:hypothetical protein